MGATMKSSMILLLAVASLAPARQADAQDRMPPSPGREDDRCADAKRSTEFKAARSVDISGPFIPLLRSPELMSRARAMGDYLRYKSSLPPRLSEFVILLTARRWTQQYEWNAHQAAGDSGRPAGRHRRRRSRRGAVPSAMADDEDAVYALWDEVQRNQSVSDATYARAVAKVGEQGVIDALGITGYYTMLAMVMNTARTPLPAGVAAAAGGVPVASTVITKEKVTKTS